MFWNEHKSFHVVRPGSMPDHFWPTLFIFPIVRRITPKEISDKYLTFTDNGSTLASSKNTIKLMMMINDDDW